MIVAFKLVFFDIPDRGGADRCFFTWLAMLPQSPGFFGSKLVRFGRSHVTRVTYKRSDIGQDFFNNLVVKKICFYH